MSDRRYARVYYSDLQRDYEHIYDDAAALGTWVQLLVIAEQAWPDRPRLPHGLRGKPLRLLQGSGLVTVDGIRYDLKGFAEERSRRRDSARIGGNVRSANAKQTLSDQGAIAKPSTKTSTSTKEAIRGVRPLEVGEPTPDGQP